MLLYAADTETVVYFSNLKTIAVFANNTTAVVFQDRSQTGAVECNPNPRDQRIYWIDLASNNDVNRPMIKKGIPNDPSSVEIVSQFICSRLPSLLPSSPPFTLFRSSLLSSLPPPLSLPHSSPPPPSLLPSLPLSSLPSPSFPPSSFPPFPPSLLPFLFLPPSILPPSLITYPTPYYIFQVISRDLIGPHGLAVDWAGNNIYFSQRRASQDDGRIEVVSSDGRKRKVLFSNLANPGPLAVNILTG